MLFIAVWADRVSLVLDAEDRDKARTVATEVAEGEPPLRLHAFPPGCFVAEVIDDGETPLSLEPLDFVAELIAAYDDVDAAEIAVCGDRAQTEGGGEVTCALPAKHEPPHRDADGREW